MQHPINSASSRPAVVTPEAATSRDPGAGDGAAHEVPDAQLWRDAIGAARRAAAAAAELRVAFEATRRVRHS